MEIVTGIAIGLIISLVIVGVNKASKKKRGQEDKAQAYYSDRR